VNKSHIPFKKSKTTPEEKSLMLQDTCSVVGREIFSEDAKKREVGTSRIFYEIK
jgi:hypothetical protein